MVIAHLVRLEALYLDRLRRILQEQHPTLQKFGPEHAPPFSRLTARDLLAGFKRQRVQTLVFLRSLGLCGWHRTAEHETLGETDLQRQVQVFIQHDTAHLGQLHDLQSLCGQESLRPPIKRRVQGFKVKTEMDIKE